MIKTIKKLRFSWLIALGLLIVGLLYLAIVPFGHISYQTDFKKRSYAIGQFLPAARVIKVETGQKIIAEPIYFTLLTPRPFNKVVVTLNLSGPVELVKLGVCRNKALWNYELKVIDYRSLKKLTNGDWQASLEFNLIGACRENNKYSFMISAPNLGKPDSELVIKHIKTELFGATLRQLFFSRF